MKKCRLGLWAVGITVCALILSNAWADIDAPKVDKTKKAPAAAPLSDRKILTFLYLQDLRENEVDRWAQSKAVSEEVRAMAGDFLKDHVFFAREVRALAGRLGIRLKKTGIPRSDQLDQLKTLSGPEFDRCYKSMMTKNSADTILYIQRQQALLPKDSPVYSLLTTVLPKIMDRYDVLSSTDDVER
jgi:predicted outer membrane protein